MTAQGWLTVASAMGQVFLGLLALLRGGGSALALPMALLCFDFFAFNIADLAYQLDHNVNWKLIDHIASPLGAPLALHVILTFTGKLRALRPVLLLAYGSMAVLSATGVAAFFLPELRSFNLGRPWGLWHFVVDIVAMGTAGLALVRFYRAETDPVTRQRARLILAAAIVTVPLALTDLFGDVWIHAPHLSNVGTLAATSLLAVSVLRFRLFGTDLSASAVTTAAVLAAGVIATYAILFRLLVSSTAALILGTASAALLVALFVRAAAAAGAARRARATQLATLGRFAAQLAHDLKNPLAAAKGAADFLLEEHHQGRSLDAQLRFITLIREQVVRIEEALRGFERLGRVELKRTAVNVDEVVNDVVGSFTVRGASGVNVQLELDGKLPDVSADPELLTRALENLVRNAFEAMPGAGTLTVRTGRGPHARHAVAISIEDTGEGMDAATCERAFDELFTTKPEGGGLGLPFVRRVVEAHGGEIVLSSRKGRGTRADVFLPAVTGA